MYNVGESVVVSTEREKRERERERERNTLSFKRGKRKLLKYYQVKRMDRQGRQRKESG